MGAHTGMGAHHFGRLRREDHLRSGVRDQPSQHGETLSLLKIQKQKNNQAWWSVPVVPATLEAEVGESFQPSCRDYATALQPG